MSLRRHERVPDTFPAEWLGEADAHEPSPPRYADEPWRLVRGIILALPISAAVVGGVCLVVLVIVPALARFLYGLGVGP